MKEVGPQNPEFIDWYSQPENRGEVIGAWFKEWKHDHWAKVASEPEQPLTLEDQAKVDAYCPQIIQILEGRTGSLRDVDEATRERALSDWVGLNAFKELYDSTSGKDRTAILGAIKTLVDRKEQDPQLLIDLIYGLVHFNLTQVEVNQVEPSIKRLSRTPLATGNEVLNSVIEGYKRSRSYDMLTPEQAEQIYKGLKNTPSQAPQQ